MNQLKMHQRMQNIPTRVNTLAGQKKVLVFGSCGQDGSLLCNSLIRKDNSVIGIRRNSTKTAKNHYILGIEKDLQIKKCDLMDFQNLRQIIIKENPNEIYNLAAQSSVGKSFANPIETIESIVNGTLNILEACKQIGYEGKIFFAGSSEIFGNTEIAADINHQQNPKSPYGTAKQTSLNLVKIYRDHHNLKCNTGILFNHESPLRGKNFVTKKIISGAVECYKNRNHKLKLGNLNIYRDWGWAEEYVEAIQLMTLRNSDTDHVICSGKLTSLTEFVSMAFEKLSLNYKDHVIVSYEEVRKSDIFKSLGDPKPFYDQFKWKAKLTISEIIDNLIEEQLRSNKPY